jgi:Ca-activated chloride channel homolog
MFRFEHPDYLYALAAIPLITILYMWSRRRSKAALARFGKADLVSRLMPDYSRLKQPLKFGLLSIVLILLIIAWANPQWGAKRATVKRSASDVIIALDISTSMLSDDVKPNRLERARTFAIDLMTALKGERIGSIVFAGNAYLQMPLTTDYAAAAMFIKSANPEQATTQGTALSEAIDIAEKAFRTSSKSSKVLIIISDGEDHDSDALSRAKEARANGMLIFTLGVGTTEGGYIPLNSPDGQDVKRDDSEQPVRTRLNEQMLRDLAAAGEGEYFNIANTKGVVPALKSKVDKMEKQEMEARSFTEFESYFQWFLIPAVLILILEFLLPFTKSRWEEKDIFNL